MSEFLLILILIDQFLEDAFEFDVDALCDGEEVYIGAIMQHIEEAGIHSGDSACVLPPYQINSSTIDDIEKITTLLAVELNVFSQAAPSRQASQYT